MGPELAKKILRLYPSFDTITCSSGSSDGRARVNLYSTVTKKQTIKQLAKVLLEVKLGRLLVDNETVDHIDEDKTNDSLDNLQLLNRDENSSKSAIKRIRSQVPCKECGDLFVPSANQVNRRSLNKSGPFCSKRCSGLFGKRVQMGEARTYKKEMEIVYTK